MKELVVPQDKLDLVRSKGCTDWLANHIRFAVHEHRRQGSFALVFEDEGDAELFEAEWLVCC